jgi:hypothetical protein
VKLTPDNYLLWRAQVLPLLRSYYLDGYVDGTLPCPSAFVQLTTADGHPLPVANPAYRQWTAQDQAILSAIQSSLTPSVAGMVLFATTSRDAWSTLEASFSSQTMARSNAIRNKLADLHKLDKSVTVYYNQAKELADTLSSIGQPLRDNEFIGYLLKGLGQDFDSLVENIEGRDADNPITPHDLYARLLNTEQRLGARRPDTFSVDHEANAASRGGGGGRPFRPPGGPLQRRLSHLVVVSPRSSLPTRVDVAVRGSVPPVVPRRRVSCAASRDISPLTVTVVSSRISSALAMMVAAMTSKPLSPLMALPLPTMLIQLGTWIPGLRTI